MWQESRVMGYSFPIPEMKPMEREIERQQPLWFEEFLHPGNTAS